MLNLYNAYNEQEQVKTLADLHCMLKELNIDDSKQIVPAGDFNSFLDVALEAPDRKPHLKYNSLNY